MQKAGARVEGLRDTRAEADGGWESKQRGVI